MLFIDHHQTLISSGPFLGSLVIIHKTKIHWFPIDSRITLWQPPYIKCQTSMCMSTGLLGKGMFIFINAFICIKAIYYTQLNRMNNRFITSNSSPTPTFPPFHSHPGCQREPLLLALSLGICLCISKYSCSYLLIHGFETFTDSLMWTYRVFLSYTYSFPFSLFQCSFIFWLNIIWHFHDYDYINILC